MIPTTTFQNSQVRFCASLIGSGEGRHTTHLLKCVLLLSTSQTDWKQSSDVLSDISFDILFDISSDILSHIPFDIFSDKTSDFFFAVRCLRATKVAGGALQSAKWVKRRTSQLFNLIAKTFNKLIINANKTNYCQGGVSSKTEDLAETVD